MLGNNIEEINTIILPNRNKSLFLFIIEDKKK